MKKPSDYQDKTCEDCLHWVRKGLDPVDLGAGVKGTCRESLRTAVAPGPNGISIGVFYVDIPGNTQACSHFQDRRDSKPCLEFAT